MVELSPTHAVVECNGIGYYLNISLNTFSKFEKTKSTTNKFYTYLSVKEDSHTLYGFFDKNERECFCLLLSVSGVGASTARMILSSLNPNDLQRVILNEDVSTLNKYEVYVVDDDDPNATVINKINTFVAAKEVA